MPLSYRFLYNSLYLNLIKCVPVFLAVINYPGIAYGSQLTNLSSLPEVVAQQGDQYEPTRVDLVALESGSPTPSGFINSPSDFLPQAGHAIPWDIAQVPSVGMGGQPGFTGGLTAYPMTTYPMVASGPGVQGAVPQQGGVVPWQLAPGAGGYVPAGQPVMPVGAPGLPAYSPGAGMWMMLWVPYGMSMAPSPTAVQPGASSMAYYPTVPYGLMPGYWPGAVPSTVAPGSAWPVGYLPQGSPVLPQGPVYGSSGGRSTYLPGPGMLPGMSPIGAYGQPYGYGFPPGGYGTAVPPSMPVQPYALVTPEPPSPAPLAVPRLPNTAHSSSNRAIQPPPVLLTSASVPVNGLMAAGSPGGQRSNTSPFLVAPGTLSASPASLPLTPSAGITSVTSPGGPAASELTSPSVPNQSVTESSLSAEGLYVLQGDSSSARGRVSGFHFLSPNWLIGGALDIVTGPDLTNDDGVQLTELYLATAIPALPGVQFRVGQLDMTSYFDRNSFAKDISRDFFNSTFHTNPALVAGANVTSSRPGGLVQWLVMDNLNLSAAVFSSSGNIADFALDGLATEVGFRMGDFVLRGTFVTGNGSQFDGAKGRLSGYGINAEWFIPEVNLGLFGRYGALNSAAGSEGNNYVIGISTQDLFMQDDRLGLAYGRNLPLNSVEESTPDVLELFYDFVALPNLRIGFTLQQRNQLQDSYAGFRIRGGLDILPNPSLP